MTITACFFSLFLCLTSVRSECSSCSRQTYTEDIEDEIETQVVQLLQRGARKREAAPSIGIGAQGASASIQRVHLRDEERGATSVESDEGLVLDRKGQPLFEPPPDALVSELCSGNVVAIIGAGLSMSAGLPGFWPLLNAIATKGGREDLSHKHYNTADDFQFDLARTLGKKRICEILPQELAAPQPAPQAYLENRGNLTSLPLCGVVSFNWDTLLDDNYTIEPWEQQGSFNCQARSRTPMWQVQGNASNCGSLVFSHTDYKRIRKARADFFTRLFSTTTVLYIGMNVRQGYITGTPLLRGSGPWPRRHYAIINDVSNHDRQMLDNVGMTAISYNGKQTQYKGLTYILDELRRRGERCGSTAV